MIIKNPTDARKDFYNILKSVNKNHEPIYINGKDSESDAVIIGLSDWKAIQETIYLEATGTMSEVRKREKQSNSTMMDWEDT